MMENGIKTINNSTADTETVVVAGGAGNVGKYFVNYLLKKYPNKKIIIVTRNLSKKMLFKDDRVEIVTSFKKLKLQDCDVYNFVYTNSSSFHFGPQMAKNYIGELAGVIDREFKGTVFHISSIAVYNAINGKASISELKGIKKKDPYAYTKALTEQYLLQQAASKNFKVKILRIGNVINPGSIWIKIIVKRLQLGLPIIGSQTHPSNTTFVGNLTYILDQLAQSNDSNVFYNVCEFGNVSWEQWTMPIAGLLEETPVAWSKDSLNEFNYGVKEDLKFLKGKVYNAVVPNVMKLTGLNTRILKLLSKRDLDKSRSQAKQRVRKTAAQPYLDVQEFKMAGIYLEERQFGTEGISKEIIDNLPYTLENTQKILKRYIEFNIN